ncbi:MAG: aminopeptidase [Deltaproteobacteria bacterium]|nr:aminopeptidase [Deltaproteobacteria bacterium]
MDEVIKKIFTVNLGVRRPEHVVVFTDIIAPDETVTPDEKNRRDDLRQIALSTAETGRGCCSITYLELVSQKGHGKEPPEELWAACFGRTAVSRLKDSGAFEKILVKTAEARDLKTAEAIVKENAVSPDCVIALSNFSTSHTRFRDLLTRLRGVRYASMPLFERSMLSGVMTADWQDVKDRTLKLKERLSGRDSVYITSPSGTSISLSIKERPLMADTGILTDPGSFGNLPAGEVFLAPVEGSAEGRLILEWAPLRRLKRPVEIKIRNGNAVDISGREPFADELKRILEKTPLAANVAELGIGTNDKATRPDNILESEKILGTVHIALGDNSSFGGKTSVPFHEDFIFFKPTLEAIKGEEKIEVLVEGRPMF